MNILELRGVNRVFGEVVAARDVTLDVRAGQFVTLLGPSGCGKTTTLRLIAGFETPDNGTISINGRIVSGNGVDLPPEERRIGMVFQEYALFPHLSVGENIGFGVRGGKAEKAARTAAMLELVGLPGLESRMPHELSGGQQQRIALARALAPQPDIVLLDEPFSNLDAALRAQVRTEVRAILKQANTTCIFVTHDQEEAFSLSDQVAVMFDGRIVQTAPPRELYRRPASREVAAFVGESNFIDGTASGDTVDTILGRLALERTAHGAVTVLLRPEMIALAETGAVEGRVVWHEFYGHDQRIGLALNDGTTLVARADSTCAVETGARVGIRVTAPVYTLDHAR